MSDTAPMHHKKKFGKTNRIFFLLFIIFVALMFFIYILLAGILIILGLLLRYKYNLEQEKARLTAYKKNWKQIRREYNTVNANINKTGNKNNK